jgi:hypothetical protein
VTDATQELTRQKLLLVCFKCSPTMREQLGFVHIMQELTLAQKTSEEIIQVLTAVLYNGLITGDWPKPRRSDG